MASKKLLCWLMSIQYYTTTEKKHCPQCDLLARILGMYQPAPDHQEDPNLDTLSIYLKYLGRTAEGPDKDDEGLMYLPVGEAKRIATELGKEMPVRPCQRAFNEQS